MAVNDKVLIDKFIQDELPNTNNDIGKAFEKFAISQVFKDYELDNEKISNNCVDGKDDGGIDYIIIETKGTLIEDANDFSRLNQEDTVNINFVTCKHADTFKMSLLTDIDSSLTDLLNFTSEPKSSFNSKLLNKIKLIKDLYIEKINLFLKFKFNILYLSRGDTSILDDNIKNKSEKIVANIKSIFSQADAEVKFIGASELLLLSRKIKKYNLTLKTYKTFCDETSYVLLVPLENYYEFLKNINGELAYYLFNSNVRDFMGENRVNTDIKNTLESDDKINFWHLNNGITILATKVTFAADNICMENVQIINGLQTSYSIFNYFKNGGVSKNRHVLIRVLQVNNKESIDKIIKATNNQTSIEIASLFATDKIQQDIEEALVKHKIYYERKANYYQNRGVSSKDIVNLLDIGRTCFCLKFKSPEQAVTILQKKLAKKEIYEKVFDSQIPLSAWCFFAKILLMTREFLRKDPITKTNRKFYLRSIYLISFIATSHLYKNFLFKISELDINDLSNYTEAVFKDIMNIFSSFTDVELCRKVLSNKKFISDCCYKASIKFNILDYFEFSNYVSPDLNKLSDD